jgi:hypothetical protein
VDDSASAYKADMNNFAAFRRADAPQGIMPAPSLASAGGPCSHPLQARKQAGERELCDNCGGIVR